MESESDRRALLVDGKDDPEVVAMHAGENAPDVSTSTIAAEEPAGGPSCHRCARLPRNHIRVLVFFWREFGAVMCVVWLAAFTGALRSPVDSFFMLGLGVTPFGIGKVGVVLSLGSFLLSPLYGWLMDTKNPYAAVVMSTVWPVYTCCADMAHEADI